MVAFTYLKQNPRRYTFEMPKVARWVLENVNGENILNLFAGRTRLFNELNEIRVDIDKNVNPNYCMDAFEYIQLAVEQNLLFDTIILDPPYSYRKSMEKYGGRIVSKFRKIKDELPNLCKFGTRVITFGYQSVSMGKNRGFEVEHICVISHGGAYHDTIATIEKYIYKSEILE